MIRNILFLIGSILLLMFIALVWAGNSNGWSFLLPSILILTLSGLAHDLTHPKPKKRQEDEDRPRKRRKTKRATA